MDGNGLKKGNRPKAQGLKTSGQGRSLKALVEILFQKSGFEDCWAQFVFV